METVLDRLIAWEAGKTPGPWTIILMPTNRCNQRCKICWQRRIESSGQIDYSQLSDERLLRLVDEAADLGVREWTITGGGEPLTRGDFLLDLCERIRARGMNGGIHTNGVLLNRARIERLVKMQWCVVHFSLDGPDAATNNGIRHEGSFERAVENLGLLQETKRAHGTSNPITTVNTVITNTNFRRLDDMVRLAHKYGCGDGLFLSRLDVHDESSGSFQLSPAEEAELPPALAKAAAVARELGINTNIEGLLERDSKVCRSCTGSFYGAVCFEAWLNAAVTPDGRVGPCCMFWEEDAEKLDDKSLEEIWLGAYMTRVRGALVEGRGLPPYCKGCHSHIAVRSCEFRAGLSARAWERWSILPWTDRTRLLSVRLMQSLRSRGMRATLRRAGEWMRVMGKKGRG